MQWRERLRLLEKLRQMIYFLKGEITYSHAPLAEGLEREQAERKWGRIEEQYWKLAQADLAAGEEALNETV